jgi:hypothetical protein
MARTARVPVAVLSLLALLVLAGCAVKPSKPYTYGSFEGFGTISYIPENPRGIVYLFHGTNGSARIVERVEAIATLNQLLAKGYGFISTESTERTGDQRWEVFDASTSTNPDLARLIRLHVQLVATTPLEGSTPIVGIGVSNGARFVTLWGQRLRDTGFPVKAIWASHGRLAPPVSQPGQLKVPTVFSTSVNDFTVPPGQVIVDFDRVRNSGTPTELHVSQEQRLGPLRFLYVDGIDGEEANGIVSALKATGVWNADGERVVQNVETAATMAGTADLPDSVTPAQAREVSNAVAVILAVHGFTSEFAAPTVAFFEAHRGD